MRSLARGHMIATSVGGTVTGKGGDFIVADDPQNPEMAESEVERDNVMRLFDHFPLLVAEPGPFRRFR